MLFSLPGFHQKPFIDDQHQGICILFLYLDISPNVKPYKLNDFSLRIDEDNMISRIAEQTGLSESKAASCIQNTIVYSHGLATMIATGILKISEKKAMSMIKNASEIFVIGERLNQNEK